MTKHVNKNEGLQPSHPFEDAKFDLDNDEDNDIFRRSSRRKTEAVSSDRSKNKGHSSKSKVNNQERSIRHETSQERRERRLRERREREAIETERRERERDFTKKRHASVSRYKPRKPPVGYKDPNDVCRQAVPGQVREEKRRQMKALMNCIAFEPQPGSATVGSQSGERIRTTQRVEEMDNSLSSDTTSDITDVTPRSSSSGCSSMSKQSTTPERTGSEVKRAAGKRSKSEGRCPRRQEKQKTGSPDLDVNGNTSITDAELEEMRYLQEAFEDFDLDEETSDFATSIISGLSEERRAKCGRKNMTFTNDQLREIERVNLILLKKIMAHRKPRSNNTVLPVQPRKTSSALNRARADKNIEKDNMVLLRKLQAVKGTTGSVGRKPAAQSAVC